MTNVEELRLFVRLIALVAMIVAASLALPWLIEKADKVTAVCAAYALGGILVLAWSKLP